MTQCRMRLSARHATIGNKLSHLASAIECEAPPLLLQGVEDANLKQYLRWASTGSAEDPAKKTPAAGD